MSDTGANFIEFAINLLSLDLCFAKPNLGISYCNEYKSLANLDILYKLRINSQCCKAIKKQLMVTSMIFF